MAEIIQWNRIAEKGYPEKEGRYLILIENQSEFVKYPREIGIGNFVKDLANAASRACEYIKHESGFLDDYGDVFIWDVIAWLPLSVLPEF